MPFRWYLNKFMCFYCCSEFVDSSKLKEHTQQEHRDVKLNNVLRNIQRKSRVKLDVSELSCKRCLKPAGDLSEFVNHTLAAHGMKIDRNAIAFLYPYKLSDESMSCLDCGQKFRFFAPLLRHVHKYHNKSSPYLCEICGQGFTRGGNVDEHIRNVHSERSFPCNKCDLTFSTLYALKYHRAKNHDNEKLRCPKCPELLKSRYLRKQHLAKVHDVKSTQFKCEECPLMFTQKSIWLNHKLKVHLKEKSVTCEICGFKVFNQDSLKVHMVKHSDDRPFECEYCKKTFQRKKTLNFHIRIHTDDRRYACEECGKAFVQVTSLKSHIRSHHSQITRS